MFQDIFTVAPTTNNGENNREGTPSCSMPADFETAISATGFGKYNFLFILIIFPAGWASFLESSTMAYVFPAAQCDLNLSLEDKGLLNAITYSGMISSAIIWGFLFDTLGRRKLLMIGFLLDAICIIVSSFAQTKAVLIAAKFFGGFFVNGPYAALSTYVSEFHCNKYRGRMQLLIAISFCWGAILLPLLAWAILPQQFYFSIFNDTLKFRSWNVLLLICSLPAIVSTMTFIFMPESPKFLMAIGENEKALSLFQKIYCKNSGKTVETFPVKTLVDEVGLRKINPNRHGGQITAKRSQFQALQEGWQQIKPLFYPPYLKNMILVCTIQALFTTNVNTLRLWFPQIFQALNDYTFYTNETSADLCKSLEMLQSSNMTSGDTCIVNFDNSSVFINSLVISVVTMVADFCVGLLITHVGKKKLLCLLGLFSGACSFTLYFSTSTIFAVTFSSLFGAAAHVAANLVIVVNIDMFPTTLRTMSLSLALMCARLGSMAGNLLFPLLIRTGCAPPFFAIGSLLVVCAFMSLLLPKTDLKPLE